MTAAGDGISGFAGDGGSALNAEMYQSQDIVSDSNGNFYVADVANNRVRKLTVTNVTLTDPGPLGNLEKAQDNLTQSTGGRGDDWRVAAGRCKLLWQ